MVMDWIQVKKITIITLYAHSVGHGNFLISLVGFAEDGLLIRGDFNRAEKDRAGTSATHLDGSDKAFTHRIRNLGLRNPWCEQHMDLQDYKFRLTQELIMP